MMNFWLTTDTHFGHIKLVEQNLRPVGFEDKIFKGLINALHEEDVFIHFGDISFDNDAGWHEKIKELPGKKWLIKGNHDKRSSSWYLSRGWDFVGYSITINHFGYKILMSHIPQPDTGYDINIHGHFHNTDHRKHEPEIAAILTSKHYLLALEYNNYLPWNLSSVVGSFKKRQEKKVEPGSKL